MVTGCLGCSLVERSSVTLRSGAVVCRQCPEWRHETEVNYVMALATKDDRKRYLAGVEQQRGKAAAQRIIADLWERHADTVTA